MENLLWWQQNMISKALYDLVIKTDKQAAKNVCGCDTCFCYLIKGNIKNSISLSRDFENWKSKNGIYTNCSSVLFYLQDLGIIEILSGVTTRTNGVSCKNLKYTIIKKNIQ